MASMDLDRDAFSLPDWDAPLDPNDYIRNLAPDAVVRGMYINGVLDFCASRSRALPGQERRTAFKMYPAREYLDILVEGCAHALPRTPLRRALFEVGKDVYGTLTDSMAGRALMAMAGNDVGRAIRLSPKAYDISIKPGKVEAELIEERVAVVRIRDIWNFSSALQPGVYEGAYIAFGVHGNVKIREHSLCDVDLLCEWYE